MDMNQIAVEIAYSDGYDAGKQAAAEHIFEEIERAMRLSKTTHVGQQFYGMILENYIEVMKKKYGVN